VLAWPIPRPNASGGRKRGVSAQAAGVKSPLAGCRGGTDCPSSPAHSADRPSPSEGS
jgi:hypothetical protein